jgi:hypothetical protein
VASNNPSRHHPGKWLPPVDEQPVGAPKQTLRAYADTW